MRGLVGLGGHEFVHQQNLKRRLKKEPKRLFFMMENKIVEPIMLYGQPGSNTECSQKVSIGCL